MQINILHTYHIGISNVDMYYIYIIYLFETIVSKVWPLLNHKHKQWGCPLLDANKHITHISYRHIKYRYVLYIYIIYLFETIVSNVWPSSSIFLGESGCPCWLRRWARFDIVDDDVRAEDPGPSLASV